MRHFNAHLFILQNIKKWDITDFLWDQTERIILA
ncbi:MAG: hypothetical protein ACJA0U_002191 [Salibacteraceae bacterium]|jgi:hypothetical protein